MGCDLNVIWLHSTPNLSNPHIASSINRAGKLITGCIVRSRTPYVPVVYIVFVDRGIAVLSP